METHQSGRDALLKIFTGEIMPEDGTVCQYSVLAGAVHEPAHSAALVAYDLQNVTSALRGRSELQPLIGILTPILDHCIRVLNGVSTFAWRRGVWAWG